MQDPQRLTAVLADPTRFNIYQYFLAAPDLDATVQSVAQQFSLHPNVARLHLNRLRDVGLLVATSEKSGRGGRPGLSYRLSDTSVSLSFPPRDFQLLARLALEALSSFGAEGLESLARAGRDYGTRVARETLEERPLPYPPPPLPEILAAAGRAVAARGWEVKFTPAEVSGFRVSVSHCSFRELAKQHPRAVCAVCQGVLDGMVAGYLGAAQAPETDVACEQRQSRTSAPTDNG